MTGVRPFDGRPGMARAAVAGRDPRYFSGGACSFFQAWKPPATDSAFG